MCDLKRSNFLVRKFEDSTFQENVQGLFLSPLDLVNDELIQQKTAIRFQI